jgi:hypothetical protein
MGVLAQVQITALAVDEVLTFVISDNAALILNVAALVTFLGLMGAAIASYRRGGKSVARGGR